MTRRSAPASARSAPDPAHSAPAPVLRVREPGDILGAIPYLLGFHPSESLVAAFVRDRQVRVTARIDLAATADLEGLVDQLELVGERVRTRSLVLVGYSADPDIRGLMRDLSNVLPFELLDVLAVCGDRWWSVGCDGPCCPAEGQPYDITSHPLAAEAVLAGMAATGTRQDIAELTAGPPVEDRDRLTRLAADCAGRLDALTPRRRRRRIKQLVSRALGSGGPSEAQAVEIAVLARDLAVRDEAWAMMTRDRAEQHVELWRRVVGVAVRPYEAAPLGMLAIAGWLSGNGALLNCGIDRLEAVDPDYTLLELCRAISDQAIAPSQFDLIADGLGAAGG